MRLLPMASVIRPLWGVLLSRADPRRRRHVSARVRITLIVLSCVSLTGCDLAREAPTSDKQVRDADPARGRAIVESGAHGCTACHAIPGIRAPRGMVGPPLD